MTNEYKKDTAINTMPFTFLIYSYQYKLIFIAN